MTLKRELGLVPLAAVVFFNVSGGPYGIEDLVSTFGPGLSLLLLVLTPLLWSLPVALVMAELAAAMPGEGGYVTWTRRAFGDLWAFQVGWWSWLNSFVDVAIYPALFVEYVRFWYPAMTTLERWVLAVSFIVALTALNVLGVRPTGRAAVVLAAATLAPVVLFIDVAAGRMTQRPWVPFATGDDVRATTIGLGLAVAIWNYSGWDTPSTVLGESRAPGENFRRASLLTLVIITLAYVVPVAVALGNGAVSKDAWSTGGWPRIAEAIGGRWLGHAMAVGAVFSAAGLFLALLLTNSRLPYILARAGQLPSVFAAVHTRFGTPWVAIVVSSAVYAAFAAFSFRELIVVNVWLHSLALIVELAAFLRLRAKAPSLARPWRVPGGWTGAWLAVVLPSAFSLLAMATAGWRNIVGGVVAALTAPAVYALVSRGGSRR